MHEESFDHPIHGYPYVLTATQYKPAAKDPADTRRNFKFAMPTMCSICGDPDAPFKRTIYNSNNYDKDLFELANSGHAIGQVGSIPSGVTEDEKNDRRLGTLKSPVCAKHTEDADRFADPLCRSGGDLRFASYRYYKAFCELNNITRAPTKRRG